MWKLLIKCGIWKNIRILKRSLMQYLRTLMVLWFYPSDEVLPWEIRLVTGIRVESWFNNTWQPWNLLWRWDLSFWLPLLHGQLIRLRRLVIFLSLQRHRLESLKAPNSWHFFSLKQRSKILMGKKKKSHLCLNYGQKAHDEKPKLLKLTNPPHVSWADALTDGVQ